MRLPEPLLSALGALRQAGASPRLAGGCVRDWLLGLEPKDFDIEVFGMDFEQLGRALAPFGPTDLVGRSFGVIKVRMGEAEYDFALPRRESKTGAGHRGFAVTPDPALTDAEAAARRDFTLNAISYDPFDGRLIDPLGGESDLRSRLLRHTGPAFADDPLRVLRAFQFAARFDLRLDPATATLCRSIKETYRELPLERVWGEWEKWGTKSVRPSAGLAVLRETGWIQFYPEVASLDGLPQDPEWHPEGDVFVHTGHCLDALVGLPAWKDGAPATRRALALAVLAHDFGKAVTTHQAERRGRIRWISPGHEAAGGPLTESFLLRVGAPHVLAAHVVPLVVNHLAHHHHDQPTLRDTAVRRLARRIAPASLDDLLAVMTSDHLGRPPLVSSDAERHIATLRAAAHRLAIEHEAPRPIVLGRHLIALGVKPGPHFGPALEAAFESQLDGAFHHETGGLEWMRNYLRAHPLALK
jgi:tRNA nucleotidyltransferase (CCA-adding enzyme)